MITDIIIQILILSRKLCDLGIKSRCPTFLNKGSRKIKFGNVGGVVFRRILLTAMLAIGAVWLVWSVFTHFAGASVKPEQVSSDANTGNLSTAASGHVHDSSAETFDQDVLSAGQPVFVDFYATWCGPCQFMTPVVDELSKQYQGKVRFFRVDIDKNPGLAEKYQIQSIPALKIFDSGKIVDDALGVTEKAVLREKIDRVISLRGMSKP